MRAHGRALPKQSGNLLEGGGFRKRHRIPAAIPEPLIGDGGNPRRQDWIAPADRLRGHRLGRAPAGPPLGQPGNVVAVVETAARVGGIGFCPNPSAADIGIKRLRSDAEELQRLLGGQPFHGGLYIDRLHQD
jgi:hypothetical protein